MNGRVLRPDPAGDLDPTARRYEAGEIGEILDNDYPEKYAYKVKLSPDEAQAHDADAMFYDRTFYFYADEIEVLA